ncbi:MAG: 1-deoxy-D-xylulose-5-phosphate synthase [Planctomycetota bacterium]|nr:MAG: 1-deoxy-D-xylulose-5-phosphate synthase [Planctomycetota bacterium]
MSLFDAVRGPEDLARLSVGELSTLAGEMRTELIDTITKTGGHLGSGLGVLELTLALHHLYDFRHDRIVFDVGHQCYPHKMLTGRRERMNTMRMDDGLCGFPHPNESEFDQFHTGHAGTSISLALGLALADKRAGNNRRTVAIVGDASYGAGVAFEAMNHASDLGVDLLVILNDNEMSISPTVGALSRYFTRLRTGPLYTGAKREMQELIKHLPFIGEKVDKTIDETVGVLRSVMVPGHMFEEYGFTYFGPMEGHDMPRLVHTLSDLQERGGLNFLHLLTKKGAGCELAADDPQKLHGVKPKPAVSTTDGEAQPPEGAPAPKLPAYTQVFADKFIELCKSDESLIGVTAAMPDGTGLVQLQKQLPDRVVDVGICEQHAVALGGGLAKGGSRPVMAIYSTFLQRGYDQVFQELCIQDANCVLALDRAGLVDDGCTHHGLFDIAYLRTFPNTVLMAPANADELRAMLAFAVEYPAVVSVRYPRDSAEPSTRPLQPIELGKAEVLREGSDVVLAAYGTMVPLAEAAALELAEQGVDATVINMRFAKPVDTATLAPRLEGSRLLVTLEEHSVAGGVGSAICEALSDEGHCLPPTLMIGVPDRFVEHGTRKRLLEKLGFTPAGLAERILEGMESRVGGALSG